MALEAQDGKSICGLARNPLGYIFKAAHPESDAPVLAAAPDIDASRDLSAQIASALGIGMGCDAADDEDSAAWPPPNHHVGSPQ